MTQCGLLNQQWRRYTFIWDELRKIGFKFIFIFLLLFLRDTENCKDFLNLSFACDLFCYLSEGAEGFLVWEALFADEGLDLEIRDFEVGAYLHVLVDQVENVAKFGFLDLVRRDLVADRI